MRFKDQFKKKKKHFFDYIIDLEMFDKKGKYPHQLFSDHQNWQKIETKYHIINL